MQIQGVQTTQVNTNLPFVFPEGYTWTNVAVGTTVTFLLANVSQRHKGFQDRDYIVAEGMYIPEGVTTIQDAVNQAFPVSIPTTTVINSSISEGSMKIGKVYSVTKAWGKGEQVNGKTMNYVGFTISALENPELEKGLIDKWNASSSSKVEVGKEVTIVNDDGHTRVYTKGEEKHSQVTNQPQVQAQVQPQVQAQPQVQQPQPQVQPQVQAQPQVQQPQPQVQPQVQAQPQVQQPQPQVQPQVQAQPQVQPQVQQPQVQPPQQGGAPAIPTIQFQQ